MIVLGIDTALQSCSAAILRDGREGAHNFEALEKGHAEKLAPMVADTLRKAGLRARDLDRVGVVAGPGAFAGVRVGLAFARGLAIGTRIEAVGVTSLAALAAGIPEDAARLRGAVIDARRGQVYAALYGMHGESVVDPFVADPKSALEKLCDAAGGDAAALAGGGAALLGPLPSGWRADAGPPQIHAMTVARLAAAAPTPSTPPAPLYLRAPDARPATPSPFEGLFVDEPAR